MSDLAHTPLESAHLALHARLVPFAGWLMPVQYASIIEEHHAVRNSLGVFDISHMGQCFVEGPEAAAWLDRMLTNRIAALAPGQGQYTLMLNPEGGVIDDLIVYRTGDESFLLVINASKIAEDVHWLESHLADGVRFRNESDSLAGLAIQGPQAADGFAKVYPGESLPPRNGVAVLADGAIVCRTGYTGEDGFEWFVPTAQALNGWERWLRAGATPCGLGARDSLRLEMGYPLNGSDLLPNRSPLEAGLGFFCDLEKGAFIGSEVLRNQRANGIGWKLTALRSTAKSPPWRPHYPVIDSAGQPIGELSSGVLSPTLQTSIGMAYLPAGLSQPGTELSIRIRDRDYPAVVVKKPFHRK